MTDSATIEIGAQRLAHLNGDDIEEARADVADILAALRSAGMVVVPSEPTARMCDVGEGFKIRCGCSDCDHTAYECVAEGYRAMIRAAAGGES